VSIAVAHCRRYTTPARHHVRTRNLTCASKVTGQRSRHTMSPAANAAIVPSGSAGVTRQPRTKAVVRRMTTMAEGVRITHTSSRASSRSSHSARTSHSETRMTSGWKKAGGSSRPVDKPIMIGPCRLARLAATRAASAGSLPPARPHPDATAPQRLQSPPARPRPP